MRPPFIDNASMPLIALLSMPIVVSGLRRKAPVDGSGRISPREGIA